MIAVTDNYFVVIDKENSDYDDSMNFVLSIARGNYIDIVESDDCVDVLMRDLL